MSSNRSEVQRSFKKSEKFDRFIDDEQLLKHVFTTLDKDQTSTISKEEILAASIANADENHVMRALLISLDECADGKDISFKQFKDCANLTPRIKGQRIEWASKLGLEAALAQYLMVGDLFDPLKGIRNMTDEELELACAAFSSQDLFRLVKDGRDKLSNKEVAQDFQNSKFCVDGSFIGSFAELKDFYDGPEKMIGSPNPNVDIGIKREHCERPNSNDEYTSTNYRFVFKPRDEWEFVVMPKLGFAYPHTPEDKGSWTIPEGQSWKGDHGRKMVPLEQVLSLDEVKRFGLKKGEVVASKLYTGPMFNLYNAVLRKFPLSLYDALKQNNYETTLFCIISGILKISRKTEVPADRRLWRGLGGMILPKNFWSKGNCIDDFRGGVEKGLMSTTTDRNVAIQYSGRDKKRGTVFEIDAGRIDIGADLKWLSQYPGEAEYLFPPLSCLEVNGEPRLDGDVIVFPLRVNVCLKGLTLEQLEERRRDLHISMTGNLREELTLESSPSSLLQHHLDNSEVTELSVIDHTASIERARKHVMIEFEKVIDVQNHIALDIFNDDDQYKIITTKAIDAKKIALQKIQFYVENLFVGCNDTLLDSVLARSFEDFAIPGTKEELKSGLLKPFPWRDLIEGKDMVDFGNWSPQSLPVTALDTALIELAKRTFHYMKIRNDHLKLENGWASTDVNWDNQNAVKLSSETVAFMIKNCNNLTSLSIRYKSFVQNPQPRKVAVCGNFVLDIRRFCNS
jgi:hypothetical protein